MKKLWVVSLGIAFTNTRTIQCPCIVGWGLVVAERRVITALQCSLLLVHMEWKLVWIPTQNSSI